MNPVDTKQAWYEANQRYLAVALERLRAILEQEDVDETSLMNAEEDMGEPPALTGVGELFDLSAFERDVLLLCAGVELDSSFADLCLGLRGGRGGAPTFGLALAALPGSYWSALTAAAPLRYWHLVELGAGEGLTSRDLRIDERILHHLIGVSHLDERLDGLVDHVVETGTAGESHRRLAEQILNAWSAPVKEGRPVIELLGPDAAGKAAVAALVCAELGVPLLRLDASVLPIDSEERKRLAMLWEREALLTGAILLVDCDDLDSGEHRRVASFLRRLRVPVVVGIAEPLAASRLISLRLDVAKPDAADARRLWEAELGPVWASLNGEVASVVSQFTLSLEGIRSAGAHVRREILTEESDAGDTLWRACRSQARPRLEGLAELIEPFAGWDDLVLPTAQLATLKDIALHLRQRPTVYEEWGFERQSSRGLGFSTLFAGESGTGKTMAAEVLAGDLCLDLYRIDLSQVVSKYIGETEKNLGQVFDAAEGGGTVLLFDEADALFGKRSEVKDSHDRYANIEVSFLLQRMETYRGVAVLTTNNKGALDQAFLRRLRFVVQFPFPDESQREQIWRRIFPDDVPLQPLDFARLARLNLTGGNIRNVALSAAFMAADAGRPVDASHVARAARAEYAKLEKPVPENELVRLAAEGQVK